MSIMEPRDPYGAALDALRQFADAGRFVPGEPIVVTELAAEVGFSPTPVREALACLAGEGLIERRRGRGYFYPTLTAAELVDLFELQLGYLHAALTVHPRGLPSLRKAALAVDPSDGAQTLFDAIIGQSANPALSLAYQRVNDRLAPALRVERHPRNGFDDGVTDMISALVGGQIATFLGLVHAHHDRRCAHAAALVRGSDTNPH